jgi:hypothetical protein
LGPALSWISTGDLDPERKGRSIDAIIAALREAEIRIGREKSIGGICRSVTVRTLCIEPRSPLGIDTTRALKQRARRAYRRHAVLDT